MREVVEAIKLLRRGNTGAYRDVVKALGGRAVRYAFHFLGNYLDAEDASQEAFLQAWRRLGQLREDESFTGWFFQILANTAKRKMRSAHSDENIDDHQYRLADECTDPERIYQTKEHRQILKEALLELPDTLRSAVILRDVEGFSYGEIARILQIPEGTVKSRISAARERLRERLYQVEEVNTPCRVKIFRKN